MATPSTAVAEPHRKRTWRRTPPPDHTPSTAEWIQHARQMLIDEGIVEVKIDRLAKQAGVTRGGFYWRFKNRDELLDALLDDWRTSNTEPLLSSLDPPGTPLERLGRLADMYISESGFSPTYDSAVRTWASMSLKVAEAVREVDAVRIDAIRQVFFDAGFGEDEAMIRARITYFHQVGYYAIGMQEPRETREALSPIYMKVLTGLG